jgi:hypothetical protein
MLTKEDIDTWAAEHGYGLQSRSADQTIRSYSKQFDKFFLSLTADITHATMKLSGFPGMFELCTGGMMLKHPRFADFFERRMVQMMTAIENENTQLV